MIKIQDVKVLSQEVFARLQAPYREKLALEALLARDNVSREEARIEFDRLRAEEQARLELMAQEARLLAERRRQVEALEHKESLERRAQEADLQRLRDRAEGDRERAQIELATKREAGELEAELERIERSAHSDLSEARLQEIMLTETMPAIAEAFRGSFDRVNVTSGDGSNLFAFLSAGLDHVMEVAQKRRQKLKS